MSHVSDGELTAYADGAYPAGDPDAARIEAHLALCANCRNLLEQVHALSARAAEVLSAAGPLVVSTPEFDDIAARAAIRRPRFRVPLTWAATVILALGIGWFGRGAVLDPQYDAPLMRQAPALESAAAPQHDATATLPVPAPAPAPASAESRPAEPQSNRGLAGADQAPPRRADARELRDQAADTKALAVAPPSAPPPPQLAAPEVAEADFAGRRVDVEYLTAAEAERRGIALHVVPELEIVRVGLRADAVAVEQKLSDGKIVTITAMAEPAPMQKTEAEGAAAGAARQRLEERARDSRAAQKLAPTVPVADSVIVTRGTTRITISGTLPADSLRALAAKVR